MIRINRIIFVKPPMSKNPKVDKSQRIKRTTTIVLNIPGSKLIRKRMTTR